MITMTLVLLLSLFGSGKVCAQRLVIWQKDGSKVNYDLNEQQGFVDENGNEVIPCKWEDVGFFSEGLAYAEDAFGRIGFIDKKGKVIIPCQWEDAAPFLNGKAFVQTNGSWLRIDKTGKVID